MYTIGDFKCGRISIDYRKVRDLDKLQAIIKAAQPDCNDLPTGGAQIYYWKHFSWNWAFDWESIFPPVLATVNDIQLPAPAKK